MLPLRCSRPSISISIVEQLLPVDDGQPALFRLRRVDQHAFHVHSCARSSVAPNVSRRGSSRARIDARGTRLEPDGIALDAGHNGRCRRERRAASRERASRTGQRGGACDERRARGAGSAAAQARRRCRTRWRAGPRDGRAATASARGAWRAGGIEPSRQQAMRSHAAPNVLALSAGSFGLGETCWRFILVRCSAPGFDRCVTGDIACRNDGALHHRMPGSSRHRPPSAAVWSAWTKLQANQPLTA